SLDWLGLERDGPIVFQSTRMGRHAEVARALLAAGKAYYCYCTQAELQEMRERQLREKRSVRYEGIWRDRDPSEAPPGIAPAIRLKAPTTGATTIEDLVQGTVTTENAQLDDMILLRSDGTPTYMHSVVVDDHDMAITHVIRGDDHLTNAFRQRQLYDACGWTAPRFAHIPLIHGPDGAKLSKRHGAQAVEEYRDMGYLPEAVRNYLMRLGWAHGDDEIISTEQAIAWFDLDAVGRSAARFDFTKLQSLNGHYLRQRDDRDLAGLIAPRLEAALGRALSPAEAARLAPAMATLKGRAKTLVELAEAAKFYVATRPLALDQKAAALLAGVARATLGQLGAVLAGVADWQGPALEAAVRDFATANGLKLGDVAQPLRAALTGSLVSPPIFDVMAALGRDETLGRIADQGGN
ncbi:MAG: glutamate--tRNA ligase, partial [Alphaproteobacteria bacterium]|nr:glutamate--tRNA ligase [Alphaproteobacteria bacterium]